MDKKFNLDDIDDYEELEELGFISSKSIQRIITYLRELKWTDEEILKLIEYITAE